MKHEVVVERHPIKLRKLNVQNKALIGPQIMRVRFKSDELSDFVSSSPDDHVKVFFPDPITYVLKKPVIPGQGQIPASQESVMRDYTPHWFDLREGLIEIDFFLHGDGVASNWAKRAQINDSLYIGGPRASYKVPYDFDGYILIGDETSIPSTERRLRELPNDATVLVFIEARQLENKREFLSISNKVSVCWVHKTTKSTELFKVLSEAKIPKGDVFAWIATESSLARSIKDFMVNQKGLKSEWIKASGYWE